MDWTTGLIAGLTLLGVASAAGLVWKASTGRLRQVSAPAPASQLAPQPGRPPAAPAPLHPHDASAPGPGAAAAALELDLDADELGDRATLVQFSTEFCTGCRPTARQLAVVASEYDGVRHVEIDLTHRADLAARFAVLQTPTTLILGADGALTARIGGVPRVRSVRHHLDTLTGRTHVAS
jgi:thiol-disulfide isomerase/thioredoxin